MCPVKHPRRPKTLLQMKEGGQGNSRTEKEMEQKNPREVAFQDGKEAKKPQERVSRQGKVRAMN